MKNYVFMISNNAESYSIKSWKKWCDKNKYELFILEDSIYNKETMSSKWNKMFVFDLFDSNGIEYDQICFVDSNILVHPNCPDFFKLSEHKFCGVFYESSYDWLFRSIEIYKKYLFPNVELKFWEYINSGFMIANKSHRDFFKDIQQFYFTNKDLIIDVEKNFNLEATQTILNFYLTFKNISCKLLPYEFNMQDMFRREILGDALYTKIGWIYNFDIIPDQIKQQTGDTNIWLERTYKELWK